MAEPESPHRKHRKKAEAAPAAAAAHAVDRVHKKVLPPGRAPGTPDQHISLYLKTKHPSIKFPFPSLVSREVLAPPGAPEINTPAINRVFCMSWCADFGFMGGAAAAAAAAAFSLTISPPFTDLFTPPFTDLSTPPFTDLSTGARGARRSVWCGPLGWTGPRWTSGTCSSHSSGCARRSTGCPFHRPFPDLPTDLSLPFPFRFHCTFPDRPLPFHRLSIALSHRPFHCPFTDLSIAISLPFPFRFHCLSLPFRCISTAFPLTYHCLSLTSHHFPLPLPDPVSLACSGAQLEVQLADVGARSAVGRAGRG